MQLLLPGQHFRILTGVMTPGMGRFRGPDRRWSWQYRGVLGNELCPSVARRFGSERGSQVHSPTFRGAAFWPAPAGSPCALVLLPLSEYGRTPHPFFAHKAAQVQPPLKE